LAPIRQTLLFAFLIAAAAPAAAQHMNADEFYRRAMALKQKGTMAMVFHAGEVRKLVKEVQAAGTLTRQTRLAAEKAGRHGRYCPPKGAKRMGQDEYLKSLAAMPMPVRKSIDLTEATTRMLEKKFPCRG